MRIFIAGVDGYLGWPLAQHLAKKGHTVAGADNYSRRQWVDEVGSHSAIPICGMAERLEAFRESFGKDLTFFEGNLTDTYLIYNIIEDFRPDTIVHLGENPSAAYSMIDVDHAIFTHSNNLFGTLNILFAIRDTLPETHLVKLGTMGEYGVPNIDIPEGFFTVNYRGRQDTLPFPREAGSWYHQTKVHDSNNVMMASRLWGLRATNVMQGIVYGTRIDAMTNDERLLTRFDFDQCFGTAINRYCCQAVIEKPLTPYGAGRQKRGFLSLRDSMQCLTLAIENPPKHGEYRVFNQFDEVYDVTELAHRVKDQAKAYGLNAIVNNVENPRIELEDHYYNPDHQHLLDLGYKPGATLEEELNILLKDLIKYKDRIMEKQEVLIPDIRWDGTRRPVDYIE